MPSGVDVPAKIKDAPQNGERPFFIRSTLADRAMDDPLRTLHPSIHPSISDPLLSPDDMGRLFV